MLCWGLRFGVFRFLHSIWFLYSVFLIRFVRLISSFYLNEKRDWTGAILCTRASYQYLYDYNKQAQCKKQGIDFEFYESESWFGIYQVVYYYPFSVFLLAFLIRHLLRLLFSRIFFRRSERLRVSGRFINSNIIVLPDRLTRHFYIISPKLISGFFFFCVEKGTRQIEDVTILCATVRVRFIWNCKGVVCDW